MSWIMRFSSSSSSSLSATMNRSSSSDTLWRSSALFTLNRRESPFAEADVSATSGDAIFWNTPRGPATALLTRSASASAMRLGTSSPTTMLRYDTASVMRTGDRPGAMKASHPMPKLESHVAIGSDRFVAAAAEAKNPTRVMATWMVARSWPESLASSSARWARLSPSSASFCSSTCLTLTRAISDIEK